MRIISNLHADTIAQAESQIIRQNGVEYADFQAFDLFLPIEMHGSWPQISRRIPAIFEASAADGKEMASWRQVDITAREPTQLEPVMAFFQTLLQDDIHAIEDVRHEWVRFIDKASRV